MKPIAELLPKTQVNQNVLSKPLSTTQSKNSIVLALFEDQQGIKTLSNILAQCFDIFPLYGREPEAAANIRKAFRAILANYPILKIEEAFHFHLKHNKDFPVPADIVHIIERGNKPAFKESVYIASNRKNPEDRTPEEWAYIREYERFIISGRY